VFSLTTDHRTVGGVATAEILRLAAKRIELFVGSLHIGTAVLYGQNKKQNRKNTVREGTEEH